MILQKIKFILINLSLYNIRRFISITQDQGFRSAIIKSARHLSQKLNSENSLLLQVNYSNEVVRAIFYGDWMDRVCDQIAKNRKFHPKKVYFNPMPFIHINPASTVELSSPYIIFCNDSQRFPSALIQKFKNLNLKKTLLVISNDCADGIDDNLINAYVDHIIDNANSSRYSEYPGFNIDFETNIGPLYHFYQELLTQNSFMMLNISMKVGNEKHHFKELKRNSKQYAKNTINIRYSIATTPLLKLPSFCKIIDSSMLQIQKLEVSEDVYWKFNSLLQGAMTDEKLKKFLKLAAVKGIHVKEVVE